MSKFFAAAVQMNSGDNIAANIAQAEKLVAEAALHGAKFVSLPENAFFLRREGMAPPTDVPMEKHEGIIWAKEAAKKHGIFLLVGSIRALEKTGAPPFNRSVLVSPEGEIIATYDKLHLFDVNLPDGSSYKESAQASPGDIPVMVRTALAAFGLTICYDLRFPLLYRALALAGAEVLLIPSAFTRPTGSAHWHVLLRARAIENGCFVIAAAQAGTHPGGRETYGHSLVVDPWGKIIAEAQGDEPQVVMAEIDLAQVAKVRGNIPVLQHHREITKVKVIDAR